MASGKKNYFRHSMNARNDHKLKTFMSLFGRNWREGYFYFFSLLELCGSDAQDGKTEHTFHINTLRELWGTSTQGAHDVCNKCASSALVVCNIGTTHVTFSLPNLLNYIGKYDKNVPNKEIKEIKERKEKKSEPLIIATEFKPEFFEPLEAVKPPAVKKVSSKKKTVEAVKTSPLATLFKPDNEIQKWLLTGVGAAQKKLFDEYSHHVLAEEIEKAYIWQLENNKSYQAGLYLVNWMNRHKTSAYNPEHKKNEINKADQDIRDFFAAHGIEPQSMSDSGGAA